LGFAWVVFLAQANTPTLVNADQPFKVTTVYLVRHAEKQKLPAMDPELTEAGRVRADALAKTLAKADIKTIITSQYLRTQQTASPSATQSGTKLTQIDITMSPSNRRQISPDYFKQIKDTIAAANGQSVLIVGHSNSVPEIIKELGGDAVPVLSEQDYDDLFIVTIYAPDQAKVITLNQSPKT